VDQYRSSKLVVPSACPNEEETRDIERHHADEETGPDHERSS
jgi:hypothetical protein